MSVIDSLRPQRADSVSAQPGICTSEIGLRSVSRVHEGELETW